MARLIARTLTSRLPSAELERFLRDVRAARDGAPASRGAAGGSSSEASVERRNDSLFLGLGLHRREVYEFAMRGNPSLEAFEAWIEERVAGTPAERSLERLAASLRGERTAIACAPEPAFDDAALAEFEERGVVILRDALDAAQLAAAERAVWEFLRMDPHDASTWYAQPFGHSIWVPLLRHPALWAARTSPRIARAFAQLWNDDDLWPTVDQVGFNPPERAGWAFPGPYLHWDCSLERPIPFDLGGLIYLTDTAAEQGAFTCVPGFHRRVDAWLEGLPAGADPRAADPYAFGAEPIPGRAGDLVIWHQALPHGSRPNRTGRPRLVQYLTMRTSGFEPNPVWR